jgi:hypothetical protein
MTIYRGKLSYIQLGEFGKTDNGIDIYAFRSLITYNSADPKERQLIEILTMLLRKLGNFQLSSHQPKADKNEQRILTKQV